MVDLDDGVAGLDDGVAGLDGGLVDLEGGDAGLDGVAGVTDANGLSGDIFFCLCTQSKVGNSGVLLILLDVTSLFSFLFLKKKSFLSLSNFEYILLNHSLNLPILQHHCHSILCLQE